MLIKKKNLRRVKNTKEGTHVEQERSNVQTTTHAAANWDSGRIKTKPRTKYFKHLE
jgi:hypothetical protein